MPHESPRIAELRRRVLADPASIAFAQLAEEYRRAGQYQEAVTYCRTGLSRHPGYLSARVTLGRALVELGELEDALHECAVVLRSAPDNLAAIRMTAEIHHRRGDLEAALEFYTRALALARFDPELEECVARIARELGRVENETPEGSSFEEIASGPGGTGDPLIDFDALLASIGAPDASPPAATERLISEPDATATPVATPLPELTMDASPGDPFAMLEQELRAFDRGFPATGGGAQAPEPTPSVDRADERIVVELEGWLRVLKSDSPATPQT